MEKIDSFCQKRKCNYKSEHAKLMPDIKRIVCEKCFKDEMEQRKIMNIMLPKLQEMKVFLLADWYQYLDENIK
jgi:hypothetical protein